MSNREIVYKLCDKKFCKDTNYKEIMSKIGGIDMDKKKSKIKFINVAAAVLLICIIGMAAPSIYAQIQWNIKFKEFKNREYEMGSRNY